MRKLSVPAVLMGIAAALVACSGRGSIPQSPLPNIGGAWEFKAVSNADPTTFTGIEVALKAGQVLVNGVEQPNGQVSATGATQITFLTVDSATGAVTLGGTCPLSGGGTYGLTGSFASQGGPFDFTYTENGNLFSVTSTLAGDNQSFIGTYTSSAGSDCTDAGTITGTVVPKLTGVYVGHLVLPDGTTDSVTATFSEDSSSNLTLGLVATGADNINFTMTGPVTGNAFLVQGIFQGQSVSYQGYFELTPTLVPSVYFLNTTNADHPVYAGTLLPQPPTY